MTISRQEYREKYLKENPWMRSLNSARQRCRNVKCRSYRNYGGRGIKCLLTIEDIKALWFRDGADSLTWPTLDRINNDGDYEAGNCRFIEHGENSARRRATSVGPKCLRGHSDWRIRRDTGARICRVCNELKRIERRRLLNELVEAAKLLDKVLASAAIRWPEAEKLSVVLNGIEKLRRPTKDGEEDDR